FGSGGDAEGEGGVEEVGVRGGEDDVDLPQQVEGAAARHAVHRRDHGLPQVVGLRADVLAGIVRVPRPPARRLPVGGEVVLAEVVGAAPAAHRLLAVDANTESTVAGTGQHGATNVTAPPQRPPDVL